VTPLRDYSPLRTHSALGHALHTPDGGASVDSNLSVGAPDSALGLSQERRAEGRRQGVAGGGTQGGTGPVRPAPTKGGTGSALAGGQSMPPGAGTTGSGTGTSTTTAGGFRNTQQGATQQ
jgi:hypothetical protein